MFRDESLVECRGRGVLKRKKEKPLVGDSVEIEVLEENTGVVVKVLPRKNAFIRLPIANAAKDWATGTEKAIPSG